MTQEQSIKLKRAFKDYFTTYGYEASLSPELEEQARLNPCEYAEACEEFEAYGLNA